MPNRMWKDSETELDFLNFNYLVEQVVEIAKDENLSPATIGIYGDWGSGKSSLMKMVKKVLDADADKKTLTVEFNGWLFEGYEDAKTALCGTILDEMKNNETLFAQGKEKIKELLKKVDWGKLLSKTAKFGVDYMLTGGIGAFTELTLAGIISSIKQKAGDISEAEIKTFIDSLKSEANRRAEIKNFRESFKDVFEKCKGERLVVFIDELDRCAPETVLDIFEAIRLFLYVPGTTFIIGADERLVSYAVKTKYQDIPGHEIDISKEYLEKLVQYPVKIPQLNEHEVLQYITCLLLQNEDLDMGNLVSELSRKDIHDDLTIETVTNVTHKEPTEGIKDAFDLANQIYSPLAELMKGNPRHCKRFFNTLMMRISMAARRGVTLQKTILAKLMLAEYYKPSFFNVLMMQESTNELKQLELGNEEATYAILKIWSKDEWVKKWAKGKPLLSDIKNLPEYFYFSRESRKLYSSMSEILSTEAKKILQDLLGSSESIRSKALESVSKLAQAEQVLISNAHFDELVKEETIDPDKFRGYLELVSAQECQNEAISKIKALPVDRITPGLVGQMTAFVKKLDESKKSELKAYLLKNNKLTVAVSTTFK